MDKLYEVAGKVMGFFEAFKGSSPAIDNDKILIVRGKSRNIIPFDEMDGKLKEVGKIIGGVELNPSSEKTKEVLNLSDEHLKESESNQSSVDIHGFERMKEELESMGLVVNYKIFTLECCDVIIAIWEDKNGLPPLYVEVTVSESGN